MSSNMVFGIASNAHQAVSDQSQLIPTCHRSLPCVFAGTSVGVWRGGREGKPSTDWKPIGTLESKPSTDWKLNEQQYKEFDHGRRLSLWAKCPIAHAQIPKNTKSYRADFRKSYKRLFLIYLSRVLTLISESLLRAFFGLN